MRYGTQITALLAHPWARERAQVPVPKPKSGSSLGEEDAAPRVSGGCSVVRWLVVSVMCCSMLVFGSCSE